MVMPICVYLTLDLASLSSPLGKTLLLMPILKNTRN
jgi:hypothetical protein